MGNKSQIMNISEESQNRRSAILRNPYITSSSFDVVSDQVQNHLPLTQENKISLSKENDHMIQIQNSDVTSQNQEEANKFDSKYLRWTREEDLKLKEIVRIKGAKNWQKIAEYFENKNARQCMYRWYKVVKPSLEQVWSNEDDSNILNHIEKNGTKNWTLLSKSLKKALPPIALKERYLASLSEEKTFTKNEELLLLLLVDKLGTSWCRFISHFPGRNENFLKNRCYSILRKKAGQLMGCEKAKLIKATELVNYLKQATDQYRQLLGQESFSNVYHKVFPNQCEQVYKNELTGKIEINLCKDCFAKLRLRIKNRIIENIAHKVILSSLNLNLEAPDSKFSI